MFTEEEIVAVFNKNELKVGLKKYVEIMDCFQKVDVSKDKEFQRLYNHFYRVRQRKPEFYQMYYSYMEKMKGDSDTISFEDIFYYIQKETNHCEVSFSSKLLATLNPNKPVWDKFVLENLGIKTIYPSADNREQKIVEAYNQICKWYKNFLVREESNLILEIFDKEFPNLNITDTKKIDLFLWQHRKKDSI